MKPRFSPWLDYAGLVATFAVLLIYTVLLFRLPYVGIEDLGPNGEIQYVWDEQPGGPRLGDRVLAVGDTSLAAFRADLRRSFWDQPTPGQRLTFIVDRAGQTLTVQQIVRTFIPLEFEQRLLSQWFLAWAFWLAAAAISLFVRPRDTRWRLLLAFTTLAAIWLGATMVSRWHLAESAIVLRMAVWLWVPVTWHLHLRFPSQLGPLPRWFLIVIYSLAGVLALAEAVQIAPQSGYAIGFLIALVGIVLTWIARVLRREPIPGLRLIATAIVALAAPAVLFTLASLPSQTTTTATALGLLALPILPFTYVYLAGRRQMGGLELWANRAFTGYLFALALMLPSGLALAWVDLAAGDAQARLAAATGLVGVVVLLSVWIYPAVQRLIERHVLGLPMGTDRMLASYVSQIVASTDLSALAHTLSRKVLPSLLIKQSALYRFSELLEPSLVYVDGVAQEALPATEELAAWREQRPVAGAWVRLALPLEIDGAPIGLLLLGAHDPDDVYTTAEIATLRSLADQTAIALAHATRTEQLRLLFQANIERHESERAELARDLHDDILQQMAILADHVRDRDGASAYASIVAHTRQMISGLRPVMLDYGLAEALEQLADDLAERVGATPELRVRLDGAARYTAPVEQHAYRIIQQAAENALKHAAARRVEVAGTLDPEALSLTVTDDGVGIPTDLTTSLGALIAQRHFGLAGMLERAQLIGAALDIAGRPDGGTIVTLRWPKTAGPHTGNAP